MDPKRTSRPPVIFGGVQFTSWQVGINRYVLKSDDERLCVHRNRNRGTYTASIDGRIIGARYRDEGGALRAAVKALRT